SLMVGRSVLLAVEKSPPKPGKPVLEVQNLEVSDNRGQPAVNRFSMAVREGEIFGIAGVEGNGQSELVEALTGLRKIQAGSVALDGRNTTGTNTRQLIDLGIAHVPEDRHKFGL